MEFVLIQYAKNRRVYTDVGDRYSCARYLTDFVNRKYLGWWFELIITHYIDVKLFSLNYLI